MMRMSFPKAFLFFLGLTDFTEAGMEEMIGPQPPRPLFAWGGRLPQAPAPAGEGAMCSIVSAASCTNAHA